MHADYRFQPSYPVAADTATIMPGDELITTCAYNTLGRTNVTTFGEGTQQEVRNSPTTGYDYLVASFCPHRSVCLCDECVAYVLPWGGRSAGAFTRVRAAG